MQISQEMKLRMGYNGDKIILQSLKQIKFSKANLDIRVFVRFTEHPPEFSQSFAEFCIVEVRILVS